MLDKSTVFYARGAKYSLVTAMFYRFDTCVYTVMTNKPPRGLASRSIATLDSQITQINDVCFISKKPVSDADYDYLSFVCSYTPVEESIVFDLLAAK